MDPAGRVVLVTGASSGIGWCTARAFARRGSTVVGVARRADRLEALLRECRDTAPASEVIAGDLGDRAFAERVVAETVERHGRLDVLVNNAALSKHKHVLHVSPEEAEAVVRVNFLACVFTTLAALPHMLRQGGGEIVNVSSFSARVVPPREAVYAASKAALSAFTEGLWHDLAGTGIHAGLVIPGPIDTEIWSKLEEPPAYRGRKYPAERVSDAILEVVEKHRFEITVPRRSPPLVAASLLRRLLPALLRRAMRRMDPVPRELIEAARARERSSRT
ncbi:MAG: SDR family NAD(P)-dependent oxidoreductase [Deltaproteobacteria bacterium]|nr:MAG: SDR family NAD(P)-dependent oxidoreductase [Deltaproteobacteria bacterium]